MRRAVRLFPFVMFLCMACAHASHAQSVQDLFISTTFKALAKAYIAISDIDTLKKNTVEQLEKLDTDTFHEKYPRTLKIIEDSPALQKRFGLKHDMSVKQAISFVRSVDKKKASQLIDAVPDEIVARHVAEDIVRAGKSADSKNVAEYVNSVWRNLQDRLDRTAKRSPQ